MKAQLIKPTAAYESNKERSRENYQNKQDEHHMITVEQWKFI
jgi:hypothetical protein